MARAEEIIRKAEAEIGITEFPPNSNDVKYNTLYYGRRVHDGDRPNATYPWCCAFIWWLLSTSGVKIKKTASCMDLAGWFKSEGRWHAAPQIGDIVFFKFGTNNRWTNHVGIVVGVKGGEIETIEGNTSLNSDSNGGCVQRRKRSKNIVGYGRPDYSGQAVLTLNMKPILKRGDKGNYVKAWQEYLITCNIDVGRSGADGDFGPFTERAVRLYQRTRDLPVTGVIDEDDWNSVGR